MSKKERPDEGPQDVSKPERGNELKGRRRMAYTTREPAKPVSEYTGEAG